MPTENRSFDYIIVGAGAAGCVLANRLSASENVSICILEAGGSDRHPWIDIPAGFVKTLYGDRFVWPFQTPSQCRALTDDLLPYPKVR